MKRSNRDATFRMAVSALLLALMLILGYVESLIPLGTAIPGIKLGLSNSVLIFAVYMLDIPTAFLLMAMKVLLSGMMFSGVSAMLYGMAGGLLSLTFMSLFASFRKVPIPAVSVIGGVMHNAGQIGMSMLILNLPLKTMLLYLAVLAGVGAACGLLTGVCATSVMKHLKSARLNIQTRKKVNPVVVVLALAVIVAVGIYSWQSANRLHS